MKFLKVLSIVALSAMTLVANAEDPQVTITLKGQNGAYAANLNLIQDVSLAAYNSIYQPNSLTTEAVGLYAIVGTKKYSTLFAEELEGTLIGFKGNSNTTYTMSFASVVGELVLYDIVEGKSTTITDGGSYEFTCAASTTIDDRFQIGAPAPEADYTRDVTFGNWGTICLPSASSSFTGMDLYTVAGYNAQEGLGVDPVVGQMEAGVPYIFKATAAKIEVFYTTDEPVEAPVDGTNYLTGTFEETTTPEKAYVVANNMLNWVAAATVPAYRAYLNYADITDGNFPAATDNAPGRKFLPAPKGVVTGLDGAAINGMKNGKYIMNGRFMIVKDSKIINVLGL